MILPKGPVVHENLRTVFVDLNSFLQTLKEDNFTGYVQVSFWDYEGILFLESGEIVNAIEESEDRRRGGEEAVENIILKSKQQDGRINVYRLAPEMVTILASTSMKEATYKELSTEFTSLDKLIEKLSKENHSGYIDIVLNDNRGGGIIFFQEGEIAEAVMTDEKFGGGKRYGKDMLNKIIEDVQTTGATFNVYRAGLEGGSERTGIAQALEFQGVIEVMQEVIRTIEVLVDGLSARKGSFRDSFKKARVEKSEDYPFLDPFAAEFEYSNGEIKFDGKISAEVFVRGLKECVDLTLDTITVSTNKDELYEQIRSALKPIGEGFGEKIDAFGLKSIMPEFLGS
jgi:hypothetical protein